MKPEKLENKFVLQSFEELIFDYLKQEKNSYKKTENLKPTEINKVVLKEFRNV